jgi:hypothetical protein
VLGACGTSSNDHDLGSMTIRHHEQAIEMSDVLLAKVSIDPEVTPLAQRIKGAQGAQKIITTPHAAITRMDRLLGSQVHLTPGRCCCSPSLRVARRVRAAG